MAQRASMLVDVSLLSHEMLLLVLVARGDVTEGVHGAGLLV